MKERIKRAYEYHNGVWPYGEDLSMVVSRVAYGMYSGDKRVFDRDTASKRNWQWVGTKADFEAYGESLKEDREWMPEVDQECRIYYSGSWRNCVYKGKTTKSKLNIVEFDDDKVEVFGSLLMFHPVQTDKERLVELISSSAWSSEELADTILNLKWFQNK